MAVFQGASNAEKQGLAYKDHSEFGHALEYYRRALDASIQVRDRLLEAQVLGNMGVAFLSIGDIERAVCRHYTPHMFSPADPNALYGSYLSNHVGGLMAQAIVVDGGLTAGRTWSQSLNRIDQLRERFRSALR